VYVIVDYCKVNLRSVQKSFELAGAPAIISTEPDDIAKAAAIILPGVGSFADASTTMLATGQMQAIRERIAAGVPFLGICLGLQLLFEHGDEGVAPGEPPAEGLGIMRGHCSLVADTTPAGERVKVPHVGWNQVTYTNVLVGSECAMALMRGIEDGSNFYYTHSYRAVPSDDAVVAGTTTHADTFPGLVVKGNSVGVQFHPEKSSAKGLAVIRNFVSFVDRLG
jgi:glutamine amidotransferase